MSHLDEEEIERRFERRQYAFARRLARESDPHRLRALILRTLAAQVQARTGVFATYCADEHALGVSATLGYSSAFVERLRSAGRDGFLDRVCGSGRPHVSHPVPNRNAGALRIRSESYLVVPISAGGGHAVVALTDRADGRPLIRRDLAPLRVLSAASALALERQAMAAEVVELRRLATIDPLTDLYNRRYFEARLDAEVQRASRQRQDLALLMLDLDDFKRVNDTCGHLTGDRVLRDVAELLRTRVRVFDVCARFGGEEFVIVMPGASRAIAVRIANRIRREVKSLVSYGGVRTTISIGVGLLRPLTTPMGLLESADRALIVAKNGGKDAVWIDDPAGTPRQTA